jgi:hypothetical protein
MTFLASMSDLRSRVRRATDTEYATARHPDTDLNSYINQAYREFYRLVRIHVPDEAFHSISTVTTTASVSTVALPTTFVSLLGVSAYIEDTWVPLLRYEFNERDETCPEDTWTADRPRYRLRGSTLHLVPTPEAAYRLRIHYVATAATVTTGGSIDGINGWEDFIVTASALEVAQKDQDWELWDRLMARKGQQQAHLETMATMRDMARPPRVTRTRAEAATRWRCCR